VDAPALDWALDLPKPKAILIVSAHWESAPLSVSATAAGTPLVYDFGGFRRSSTGCSTPPPTPATWPAGWPRRCPTRSRCTSTAGRGLDHGAWVPLMVMYPLGDVPVLQLSLPTHDPDRLLELGRRLRPLRAEGVLVIGSGFMTHGLPFLAASTGPGRAPRPAGPPTSTPGPPTRSPAATSTR
jgi:4,5-DOPA dioxygenase extradiol